MKSFRRSFLGFGAIIAALHLSSSTATAQTFPSRPMTMVVPFAAGGPQDVLGRLVARRGFAFWVWDRSGSIGRVLVVVGFGLATLGLTQGAAGAAGTSLILLGALMGMAGIWLILPGP